MPGCCADYCTNSFAKKFQMFKFPREPDPRRALWVKNVDRADWIPTPYSMLCEAHFSLDSFITAPNGKKKLSPKAIPTIFKDRVNQTESQEVASCDAKYNGTHGTVPVSANDSIDKNFGNSQGKVISSQTCPTISGAISILKTPVKTMIAQSSPMMISTNPSILQNQIRASNSQKPIIIPPNTSILKPQVQTAKSQLTSINLTNVIQDTSEISKSTLVLVLKKVANHELPVPNSQTTSPIIMETVTPGSEEMDSEPSSNTNQDDFEEYPSDPENLNEQKSSVASSTGIIMNKAQAKKLEDERFEKMNKLLSKQLKLNIALRKKLNLMNHKMQQLVKEKNNDCKAFLRNVFTDDQIRVLELRHTNPKSITAWSYKTMMKAMKLKQECGTRGYEELLAQNLPLPSIRTICRWCTTRNIPIP